MTTNQRTRSASGRPDETIGDAPHYRAYLPTGVALVFALMVIGPLIPLWVLVLNPWLPDQLMIIAASLISASLAGLPVRRVVLSPDGRLLITGFGQRIDVDTRELTAITVSRWAHAGFGFAVVHWKGGRFRVWQAMRYQSSPPTRFGRLFRQRPVAEDFRTLVYRLWLSNPSMTVEGVPPPMWWRSPNGGQHPGGVAGLH
ncbi:hypothetical protein BZB76_3210 [Actinomadura pelletieri DSM 43383]|uniref:PH (Pleckstrin Homology) domain-containing protein n=1 Tax=Actinomadura pelletieri DSM 43383 TaxID=1120940 RepID=A0A495QNY2_9ACTN|nr:hypothetical protein [Actinomadura pelletieri]RKS74693.1 hypothetical protein BZB76_3210 [Actinomadura pelletieri DSM 43383]